MRNLPLAVAGALMQDTLLQDTPLMKRTTVVKDTLMVDTPTIIIVTGVQWTGSNFRSEQWNMEQQHKLIFTQAAKLSTQSSFFRPLDKIYCLFWYNFSRHPEPYVSLTTMISIYIYILNRSLVRALRCWFAVSSKSNTRLPR